jgi:hypothetical protein
MGSEKKRSFKLALPPYVPGFLESDCWARGLSSWVNAMNNPPEPILPDYLLHRYAEKTNGGTMMTFNDLRLICRQDWGMKAELMGGPNFTWDFIYEILTSFSLIYLAYPISGKLAHTVVLYGIGGLESSKYTVNMMDPIYAYREGPLSQFQEKEALLVGFLDRKGTITFPGKSQ